MEVYAPRLVAFPNDGLGILCQWLGILEGIPVT